MAGIYLHIPFCERKCLYCDFYSIPDQTYAENFTDALCTEIALTAENSADRPSIGTVYLGGGTPSLLSSGQLKKIFAALRQHWVIDPDAEISIEVNPGTVDRKKFSSYLALGINRATVGIQSFHNDELSFLGRMHTSEEAISAVIDAQESGFANIGIDLIFSIPEQTLERWEATLHRAIELKPQHISAYSLIIEEGTPLFDLARRKIISPVPHETDAELYRAAIAALDRSGYPLYEISNFAQPEFMSRHNSNYWNHTEYFGFGPSAHSFRFLSPLRAERRWNNRDLIEYIGMLKQKLLPAGGKEIVEKKSLLTETVMLGLRTGSLDLGKIREIFSYDLAVLHSGAVDLILRNRFAVMNGQMLRLTVDGLLLCDEIAAKLTD